MADMITAKETAAKWGISERRVTTLCKSGMIPGAVKNKSWFVPADAQKPDDRRIVTGAYRKPGLPADLPLPVGVSDFSVAVKEYYYVDKTLLIKQFLDDKAKVTLFTRPRRFGKTLNMDMLKTYFEISGEDTAALFADKKIWSCGEKYQAYQGKYPVIFISFKDIRNLNWNDSLKSISMVISGEYLRHAVLRNSAKLSEYDKAYYDK